LTWFFPRSEGGYEEQKCKFKVDATADPQQFDWWAADKPESIDMRVFSLSNNLLRMGTNLDFKTRPESLETARWQFTVKRIVTADTPAPAKEAAQNSIPGWGEVVDPAGDSRIAEESGTVSITVPGAYRDLVSFPTWTNWSAPRVLQDVEGDFVVQVRARKFEVPQPKSFANKDNPYSYVSSGLLVWQDRDTFLRLQRSGNGDSGNVGINANQFSDGDMSASRGFRLADEDVYLRVERKDGQISESYSTDGESWTPVPQPEKKLEMTGKVKVGIFVVNATTREIQHEFSDFKLETVGSELPPALPPALPAP
jgi:regulation of enolase protein 1 (concanavalin A-like superfamily)